MTIKGKIKEFVEKSMNIYIYRRLPRGIDLFYDISNYLPMLNIKVVFDVGANVGQSARNYLQWFPDSIIYCFEPVIENYNQLLVNIKNNKRIKNFNLAIGSSRGKGEILIQGKLSRLSSLQNRKKNLPKNNTFDKEDVNIEKLDDFCQAKNIDYINFLKVDTEGNDLEVLKGANNMLNNYQIDIVEIESGMNPNNKLHVPFEKIKKHLESKKYFLFGIYEQVGEVLTKEPHLRRVNSVFISEAVIKK